VFFGLRLDVSGILPLKKNMAKYQVAFKGNEYKWSSSCETRMKNQAYDTDRANPEGMELLQSAARGWEGNPEGVALPGPSSR